MIRYVTLQSFRDASEIFRSDIPVFIEIRRSWNQVVACAETNLEFQTGNSIGSGHRNNINNKTKRWKRYNNNIRCVRECR